MDYKNTNGVLQKYLPPPGCDCIPEACSTTDTGLKRVVPSKDCAEKCDVAVCYNHDPENYQSILKAPPNGWDYKTGRYFVKSIDNEQGGIMDPPVLIAIIIIAIAILGLSVKISRALKAASATRSGNLPAGVEQEPTMFVNPLHGANPPPPPKPPPPPTPPPPPPPPPRRFPHLRRRHSQSHIK